MRRSSMLCGMGTLLMLALLPSTAWPMCGYFGPFIPPDPVRPKADKVKDVLQPSQVAYITWDPVEKVMTVTVQPRFEGSAKDFGMVIPTPSKPKLDEMPRDFFKELAVFTTLKAREQPQSKLLAQMGGIGFGGGFGGGFGALGGAGGLPGAMAAPPAAPVRPAVRVVETGLVGALDYKIIEADRADALYTWLKDNKYSFTGDEATLDYYVKKKWVFTVMKIDTTQMKRNRDGSFTGDVSPTRFQFASEQLVYPLKITQISVKDKTEALFYVQAPFKVDLPGDMTYQYRWAPMLSESKVGDKALPGRGDEWLRVMQPQLPALKQRSQQLGFTFTRNLPPQPNRRGVTPTNLEWAKRLRAEDTALLLGKARYSEIVPNVDFGFTPFDTANPRRAQFVSDVITKRLMQCFKERPDGYLVREAAPNDILQLRILAGHLKEGMFLTKFRKTFVRGEMDDDLVLVPAGFGRQEDRSEYEELLSASPLP